MKPDLEPQAGWRKSPGRSPPDKAATGRDIENGKWGLVSLRSPQTVTQDTKFPCFRKIWYWASLNRPPGVVNDSINLDPRAPEAMENVLVRCERCKVQPPPAVQTNTAQQAQHTVGLVFSMWPQSCDENRELGIGQRILRASHAAILSGSQEGEQGSNRRRMIALSLEMSHASWIQT